MATGDTSDPKLLLWKWDLLWRSSFGGNRLQLWEGLSHQTWVSSEQTRIKMWAWAFDLREDAGHNMSQWSPWWQSSLSLHGWGIVFPHHSGRCQDFGATEKAPHQWGSKDEVRLKHFYPRWSRQDGLRPHRVPDGVKKNCRKRPMALCETVPLVCNMTFAVSYFLRNCFLGNFGETCQCTASSWQWATNPTAAR